MAEGAVTVSKMADPYETLARWYLRFNGYLGVENFIVHESRPGRVTQHTEFDVVAVRFPYSKEVADFPFPQHEKLEVSDTFIDFVVAEAKPRKIRLHRAWKSNRIGEEDPLAYLIRWLGSFKDESTVREIAENFRTNYSAEKAGYRFRLIYFVGTASRQLPRAIPQITFGEIAEFLIARTLCYSVHGLGPRSHRNQWPKLIKNIWDFAYGTNIAPSEKVERILDLVGREYERFRRKQGTL